MHASVLIKTAALYSRAVKELVTAKQQVQTELWFMNHGAVVEPNVSNALLDYRGKLFIHTI